ncbi:DUF3173 domain-containing protein [Streptococcus suis]|uniref:DUF3173 domain-containing protein n=1 Tax=Streptococcus suis TaxID=1307 RepID=UPI00211D863C|nr:DUF3173 domain-containing protein [Streptococcus suis]UUM58109.1 DUF3173 domain-containing protein [Streptococcus suis]
MKKQTVNHKDLMNLGFPEHTARDIIREAKAIAVQLFIETSATSDNMVKLTQSPFDNVRLNLAPAYIVEEMLGFELPFNGKELEANG